MNKEQIGKNTIYSVIKQISTIIFPLITFPYISRVLLVDNVGKINFGESVISYVSLIASLGISTYAVRECSKVKESKKELSDNASQILSINLITTIIAYIVLGILLLFVDKFEDYRLLIGIQSITIIFTTLGADWLNTAMEDLKFIAVRTVIFQVVALSLMFIFVHKPEHYYIYALITVVSGGGANIVNMVYRRRYCNVSITTKIEYKKHIVPILLMFSMILSQTIYCNSDITIVGLIHGDHEVGIYSVAVKIYNIVNALVASISFVVMPKLSYWFEKKNYDEINKLVKYALNFIVFLGLPCLVGINTITSELIQIIAGNQYLDAVIPLRILSVALLFSFLGGFCGNIIFLPSGREAICLRAGVTSAIVNLVLNIILVPKYGIIAAAATTAFSELISFLICKKYIEREIKIKGISKMIKSPVFGCCGIIAVGLLGNALISGIITRAIVILVLSIVVYIGILLAFKDEFLLNMVNPAINKFMTKR